MKKIYCLKNSEEIEPALNNAVNILRAGGIVAVPTDTVYGFAADVHNEDAIAQLYAIKERALNKSIAVLLGDVAQAELVAEAFPECAKRMAAKYWPGALTVIVRKKEGLPKNLTANETIGLRIPDHNIVRDLIRRTGPLAVTSANLSGQTPAKCVDEFLAQLGDKLNLILDDGPAAGGIPSTVVNCAVEPPVILRQGAIPGEDLLKC